MGRHPRPVVRGALYHVMGSAVRGEAVFAEERDVECFVRLLRDVTARDGWTISAWSLREDRYQLAVRSGRVGLPRSMRLLLGGFAQEYNRRHDLTGPLWQGRYRAALVDDTELARLVAYVNCGGLPAWLAGMVSSRSCGHGELTGEVVPSVIAVDATLGALGRTWAQALAAYESAVAELSLTAEPTSLPWWGGGGAGHGTTSEAEPRLTAAEVLARACDLLGIEVERLAGRRRDRETAALRELVATVAVESFGVRAVDLARLLGKHPDWVSHWAGRGARRRAGDPEYRLRLEDLERGLRGAGDTPPPLASPRSTEWAAWM